MKVYTLKKSFHGYKKGTSFYLIAQSEFIGVKDVRHFHFSAIIVKFVISPLIIAKKRIIMLFKVIITVNSLERHLQ